MGEEQYSLCWDNFHKNMSNGMQALLENEDLVDVTLAVEGKYIKAHKIVLSICSPYFKELFQSNPCKHPIVFMKDVSYIAMNDLLTFMYQGEVQVNEEHINVFVKTAEALQVQGITGECNDDTELGDDNYQNEEVLVKPVIIQNKPSILKKLLQPSLKRRRLNSCEKDVEIPTTEEIIEFKMEPYDETQTEQHLNETYEHLDDDVTNEDYHEVGVEDQLDETENIDDAEDYAMLESGEEPKPGTSNEVAVSDGQVKSEYVVPVKQETSTKRRKPSPQKVIHQGFVYHLRLQHHGKTRYFRCAKERYTGCTATAKMDVNATSDQLTVIRPHNHPPDTVIEEKTVFENQLRHAVQTLTNMDIKSVYNSVAAIHPDTAQLLPFGSSLYCKMKRWRRSFLQH
ncbi:protein tramtrack, beta isoform-like isoform X2 [Onthophagus taurus]|uniref:protein tramtrack, beta isoform-like isoform X2 n=1 Tax=Onthophagus taurus TaxID=166361 RepID=UPI000C20C932|nr:protein tramtrack, beta isoform-like isoform X2 [Onthophagus taurus]